jgi:glycosyltransferase involved in cell wall biosynthesis
MAAILADGAGVLAPRALGDVSAGLTGWMGDQRPFVCGARAGLHLDLAADDSIVLLQPTRVVGRKRIERDWELVGALLEQPAFRRAFEENPNRTLTLHVTGPVPIEHQADLEKVLAAYREVLRSLPEAVADRLFQSFSVGTQKHPSLDHGLSIADIYQMADMILFPSETEGRGLPIPESAAARIPIVCSRYDPVEVFEEVVGEHRDERERILYLEFPEREFGSELLDAMARMLLDPGAFADRLRHNRDAVRARYSLSELKRSFAQYLERLEHLCRE